MLLPSKELLSEVWGSEVTSIENICNMWDMEVLPFWVKQPGRVDGFIDKKYHIAIETIAYKCKKWALSKGYQFKVYIQTDGEEEWQVGKCGYGWDLFTCKSIQEACEWIMEQNK
jgi:hypothetical protein